MNLILNSLKRIDAKHGSIPARFVVRPVAVPAVGPAMAPNAADVGPSAPTDDSPPLEPFLLDGAFDQLQGLLFEAGLLDGGAAGSGGNEVEVPVVEPVLSEPSAATAQQILGHLPHGRSHVLLFTSPADGQGKTMTLARLAPRLARGIRGHVLLVDANFRNPNMARWLAVAPAWRLPDVLAGAADWAAAVQTTAHERVSLLPGGPHVLGRGSGRLLQDLEQLLRNLARHYELVLVDAPSLAHRETARVAAACDAVCLVVRLGEASPRMLHEAVRVVYGSGGWLLGCVAIDA